MKRLCRLFLVFFMILSFTSSAMAAYNFRDERFAGVFTTENIDAIIDEY